MTVHFDEEVDRRASDSAKWNQYDADVLPMWVADMDFISPQAILDALHERVDHGIFGYAHESPALGEVISDRLYRLYGWQVSPDEIHYLPGLVVGLNLVNRTIGQPGDDVLVNTPVYGPFLTAPRNQDRTLTCAPLRLSTTGHLLDYQIDFEALNDHVNDRTRLFTLCNPHNPTGNVWSRSELEGIAELAERHDLVVCSDEIHCDLLLDGSQHIPFAAVSPEAARRTITLMAPSKTFNIPSLGAAFAVIQDKDLHRRVHKAATGIIPHMTPLATAAMLAAYTQCESWLNDLRAYLTVNRDFLVDFIRREMPSLRVTCPSATYLAWIDCRDAGIGDRPDQYFLREARVAMNDGPFFGDAGAGFVRLNFGCPRATLEEGLTRMRDALNRTSG